MGLYNKNDDRLEKEKKGLHRNGGVKCLVSEKNGGNNISLHIAD